MTKQKPLKQFGVWEVSIEIPKSMPIPTVYVVEQSTGYVLALYAMRSGDVVRELTAVFGSLFKDMPLRPKSIVAKKDIVSAVVQVVQKEGVSVASTTKLPAVTLVKRMMNTMLTVPQSREVVAQRQVQNTKAQTMHAHKRPNDTNEVMQFKVTLNHVRPTVWRRIRVPGTYSFGELSLAILDAFDRAPGYHLHGYRVTKPKTPLRESLHIGPPNPDGAYDEERELDERKEYIAQYFPAQVKQCEFTYDYGDNWDHTVLYEGTFPKDGDMIYPQLLDGKNATPPEDCGGVGGYERLQKIMKNPKHSEHKEMKRWLKETTTKSDIDPKRFNPDDVHFGTPAEYAAFLKKYEEWY